MADVKWIKLDVEVAMDSKVRRIRELPQGNDIALFWIFLLALAGRCNDNGAVYFVKNIPFTSKSLSKELNFSENLVKKSLKIFEEFELISIEDDYIFINNWEKWQNVESMEKVRKQTRERVARCREKAKCNTTSNVTCNATVTLRNATEEEEEADIRDIKETTKEKTTCLQVTNLYNEICISYPKLRSLSDARKKAINARLKIYSLDDFKTVFEKAEASSFMKGANNNNWTATFDWMIKDSNMAKILDGNYDNKVIATSNSNSSNKNKFNQFESQEYNMKSIEESLGL